MDQAFLTFQSGHHFGHGGRLAALLVLALWRYMEQRFKATNQAYWSVITLTAKDGKLDPAGSFVSKPGEDAGTRAQNYQESIGWYAGITADMFGGPPATRTSTRSPTSKGG